METFKVPCLKTSLPRTAISLALKVLLTPKLCPQLSSKQLKMFLSQTFLFC